jgi:hypothetical protein
MEKPDGVLTGGPAVSGPTFGDEGGMDDSGADEIADMIKKIKTGEPVKITTDMPVKVTSDEPIKGTTDKLNKVTDTDTEKETYDNSPADPTKVPKFDPNSMADMRNKIDMAEIPPGAPGDNRLPKKKEEESMDPFSAFESKLMNDYKKFVEETEQKTMSRAAKGHEKYGKAGMQALAKAGREGKDLDKVRDKYNKYDEATHQAATTMKHVKNPTAGEKKAAKDIKPGIKGYADRVAMLKSAEKDGRLK